jgi:hypothetical protein
MPKSETNRRTVDFGYKIGFKMAIKHAYAWMDKMLTFEADERVDREIFSLAAEAWGLLDKTLDGLKIKHDSDYASRLLLVYLATRIQGVTAAGTMLVAQRLGREAIIMSRCQYDYFLKMLYYDAYKHKADKVIDMLDEGVYDYDLAKKAGLDVKKRWKSAEIARLESLLDDVREPNFTNEVRDGLKKNSHFLKAGKDGDPFAKGFFKNIDASFGTFWKYGSSVVHASPIDMPNVIIRNAAESLTINVDSRMKAPNLTIADLAQRCFSTTALIRVRFGLNFPDDYTSWAERLSDAASRYSDEPTDVRSMHD